MAEAAQNLEEDVSYEQGSLKKPQGPDSFKKPELESINQSKLTPSELKALEDGATTIDKLVQKRNQYKQAAKAELQGMVKLEKSSNVVNIQEYKSLKKDCEGFEKEIEETESPEKMKDLLDKIKELPKKKEQEKANKQKQKEEEKKPLDINSKELRTLRAKFDKICDDNEKLIGTKQVLGFKKWFELELQKKPTIAFANEQIEKLEGKRVYDKGGLAPRREVYKGLNELFQRYKLGTPQKSDYIRAEGLSERQTFLKEAALAEDEIKRVNDSFWSQKAKDKTMQQVLLAKSPNEQREITKKIKNISKIESEGFVHMKDQMQAGGVTIRKMSDASIAEFLKGLIDEGDINKRLAYITGSGKYENGIKEAVENEGSLAGKEVKPEVAKLFDLKKGLEGIYSNDKEGLKTALKSFESLNFMQKIKALKEHATLVEKTKDKKELQKILTVKAAHAKIDEAARKKIISEKTQQKYKEWFKDEKNYKDPKTGKPGSLDVLKRYYEILTNPTPDGKARNLKAYEVKRERFKNEVKELQKISPNISEEELKKWQEKYDKRGWTERKRVFKEIKKEQEKLRKEQKKKKDKASLSETTNENKDKEKAKNLTKNEAIRSAIELINDDQAGEALKRLIAYNDIKPDDPDIIFWMEVAVKRIKEFGSGKKLDTKAEKQIDDEIKSVAESDTSIKEEIEEQNLITLNLEGTKLSEERHSKKKEGQDRAETESVSHTQSGSLEKDLTKDFYEQTDDSHVLNEKGTGEEMAEIKFDEIKLTKEKIQALKETTRQKETRLFDKKGFTHVKLKDKSGRQISTDEALVEQKKDLGELEGTLAQKAMEKIEKKIGKAEATSNIFNLNARITARRKTKELIEEKRHSHEGLRR